MAKSQPLRLVPECRVGKNVATSSLLGLFQASAQMPPRGMYSNATLNYLTLTSSPKHDHDG